MVDALCARKTLFTVLYLKERSRKGGGGIFSKYTHVANYRLFITKLSET